MAKIRIDSELGSINIDTDVEPSFLSKTLTRILRPVIIIEGFSVYAPEGQPTGILKNVLPLLLVLVAVALIVRSK